MGRELAHSGGARPQARQLHILLPKPHPAPPQGYRAESEYDRVNGAFWDVVIEADGQGSGEAVRAVSVSDWKVRATGHASNAAIAGR